MSDAPRLRHAVRVLLLDERDRVLLFRGEEPDTGRAFWFPAGGGLEEGEDVQSAAVREVTEETGLADVDSQRRWCLALSSYADGIERLESPAVEAPRHAGDQLTCHITVLQGGDGHWVQQR